MNKKKIFYNVISGILGQFITIVLGLIVPRLIIINFGSNINGLLSSIIQIYACLALLESGVGTATLQALYSFLAKDDKKGINRVLSATNKYYKKIGKIYLIVIIIISLVYQPLLAKNIDYFTVFFVVLFTGLTSVFNFLFYGKYILLLRSEGKSYIVSNLNTVINILISIAKVVLILNGANVVIIQISFFLINLVQFLYIKYLVSKEYKWIDLNVEPDYKSISQKNSVLIHEITAMIFNNTDIIILTIFCGLEIVSIYTVYNYFFKALYKIIMIFSSSTDFALGSTYNSNKIKFYEFYEFLENYFIFSSFIIFGALYVFIIPIMKLYTYSFKDVNYIFYELPILFTLIELLTLIRKVPNSVISIAGHFRETRIYSVIESSLNLIFTLALVSKFNIAGVLIATIISLIYRTNNIILYANKVILNRNPLKTYYRILINTIMIVIFSYLGFEFLSDLDSYFKIITQGILFVFVTSVTGFIINILFNKNEFKYLINILRLDIKKLKL